MSQEVEVTLEDQKRINAFSRLNAKMHEFEAQLKAKKKLMEDLEDAENELMLSDEETIKMVVGDFFLHMEKDSAEEQLGVTTEETKGEIAGISEQLSSVNEQLAELKSTLYAKFKDTINLDE
mmetsp:Transcript_29230/g.63501  ORF Transcript_29230/g.63501 Transcript_29230/m.63501 type:complete len:122 (+) Transcript_29230:51-416(+)